MCLSEEKVKILVDLLNLIIPESKELNMPSGSFIINDLLALENLDLEIGHLFEGLKIETLDTEQIEIKYVFDILKSQKKRLFFNFCQNVIMIYYTNQTVINLISKSSSPPFPNGNRVKELDYSILENVFLMGCKYRKVSN